MAEVLSEPLLARFSEFVASRMGLHFPRERWQDLERGLLAAAREQHFPHVEAYVHQLLSTPLTQHQIEVLASQLTVGETYFFREPGSLDALERQILPELLQRRRGSDQRLRIWSAGCASGEEPYSVAILLSRVVPDLRNWHVTILATDINPSFLRKASEGVYGRWSFRGTPPDVQERYFRKVQKGRYEVLPQIREMVTFAYLNLAEDAYPSLFNNTNAMDIILCRNVLLYFTPAQAQKVIWNFHRALVDGGWLIVSPSEASHTLLAGFEWNSFADIIAYRKGARGIPGGAPLRPLESTRPEWSPPPVDTSSVWEPQPLPPATPEVTLAEAAPSAAAPPASIADAEALYAQGRYAEAVEELLRALPPRGADPRALLLLARACANQGRLDDALQWGEKAVAANRLDTAAHYLLATIQQERGQIDEAVRSLRRVLYLDAGFVLAHLTLGNLSQRQRRPREARKHLENALALLSAYRNPDQVPGAEGITAGRLAEIIRSEIHRYEGETAVR